VHAVGVHGCGASALSQQLARSSGRSVLHVVAEPPDVVNVVDDLRALHGGLLGQTIDATPGYFDVSEGTPFDNAKPNRQRELQRIAARVGFRRGLHRVLVVPARSLLRKHVPEALLSNRTRFGAGARVRRCLARGQRLPQGGAGRRGG
jgi:hypothetical protein